MHPTITELLRNGPVITDGAWGTQLQAHGLALGECPDLWNLTYPNRVREVARSYVEAGSRVILTNTFGANRFRLQEAGLLDHAEEINRVGVEISRAAAGDSAAVFASIGPSGRMLVSGEVSGPELLEAFSEQAHWLADAGADALVIETMTDLDEAIIAVQAARETKLPIVASMFFETGREQDRTMLGQTAEVVARKLAQAGAEVIGANCGRGIEGFVQTCRGLKAATDRPIWIKPNAGLPLLEAGRAIYRTSAEDFASQTAALLDAGVSFLGGCCGTEPSFIRALCSARDGHQGTPRVSGARLRSRS